jgi:hypothetical protein
MAAASSSSALVVAEKVVVPLPKDPNYPRFNKTTRRLLEHLLKWYPKNDDLLRMYNAFKMVAQASPSLPGQKFFSEVFSRQIVVTPPAIEPKETRTLLELIRADDYKIFCQDFVIEQFGSFIEDKSKALAAAKSATDTRKHKIWDTVKKMTLYSGHPTTGTVTTGDKHAAAALANVDHFNRVYGAMLQEFTEAFPCDHAPQLIDMFAMTANHDNFAVRSSVFHKFKQEMLPRMGQLMQNPLLICESPAVFQLLPFVCELPLKESWEATVLSSEDNMNRVGENMYELMMASTGLHNMNAQLLEGLQRDTARAAETIADPTNQSEMHTAAMAMLQSLQQNRSFESVKDDVKSKIGLMDQDMMSGLIAAVCPTELEALQGALNGIFTGATGAPAFGDDAPHPAWATEADKK